MNPNDSHASWFPICTANEPTGSQSISEVLDKIKGGAFRGAVSKLRAEDDKDRRREIKKTLPAFTPCGVFQGTRKAENMIARSGFIMLDIDDLGGTGEAKELRDSLGTNPHAAAAFISAGGAGVAVLMRIADPPEWCETPADARRYYAAAYEAATASISRETDKACKDCSRLRFVSDDPGLWVKWDAKPLPVQMHRPEEYKPPHAAGLTRNAGSHDDTQETARRALGKLGRHRADDYHDWVSVGMALHAAGLPCSDWDEWSRQSAKWQEGACLAKWQSFREGGVGIGTLVHLAKQDDPLFMRPGYRPDGTPAGSSRNLGQFDASAGQYHDDAPPTDYAAPEFDDGPPPPAGDGDEPKILEMRNAGEWYGQPIDEPDPLLPGLFERGDKVLLSGASKSRKSFFILQLSIAQASGKPFLRWQAGPPRRVLLVQLEVKECHYHKRLKRLMESTGTGPEEIADRLSIVNGRGKVKNISQLTDTVEAMKPELVIIDPLYKLMNDENDTEQVSEFLHALDRLAEKSGAAILYVHHHAKGNGGDRSARDRASGSGRFARDYDAAFDMTHHAELEDTIVLSPDSRNHLSPEPFCIRWEDDRFIDAPETIPEVKTTATQAKKQAKDTPRKPAVRDDEILAMVGVLGPMLSGTLEEKIIGLGATRTDARNARSRLIDDGKLATEKAGVGGKGYRIGLPNQIKKQAENKGQE